MKIAVIGKMGSGKSTFATKLGKVIGIEVTHMDKIYHRKDWSHISREELIAKISQIIKKEEWIIDGNYRSTIDQRLNAANIIIYFDIPTLVCVFRIYKRIFKKHPDVHDKVDGLKERISPTLIPYIIYSRKRRAEMLQRLEPLRKIKKIYIIRNNADADRIIRLLTVNPRS